jgi:hypothetical protein
MTTTARHQAVTSVTANFPNVTATTVDLPRPRTTPQESAYAEGTDHVTRAPAIDEFYAGEMIVHMPSTLVNANVFLRTLEVRKVLPIAQKGVTGPAGALFPTGAPTDSEHVKYIVNTTGNEFPTNTDAVLDLFGMLITNADSRSYPGITLRAGEYLRFTLYNNTGGALNSQTIRGTYKLGLNQSEVGRP